MAKKQPMHLAYLIRLWQVHSEGKTVWRASLEDAHSGEKRGFGSPAGLFAYLQEKLNLKPGWPENSDRPAPSEAENQK